MSETPTEKRCLNCDYILERLTEHRCPECAQPFDPTDPTTYGPLPARSGRLYLLLSIVATALSFLGPVLAALGDRGNSIPHRPLDYVDYLLLIMLGPTFPFGLWLHFAVVVRTVGPLFRRKVSVKHRYMMWTACLLSIAVLSAFLLITLRWGL